MIRISYYLAVLLLIACSTDSQFSQTGISADKLNFRVDTLATGLVNPWSMAFLPDQRILIVERPGRVRIYENDALRNEPLSGFPEVFAVGQGGLLDVVLHPDYGQNGWIYFAYAAPGDGGGNTAIARAKLSGYQLTDFEKLFQTKPLTNSSHHFGSRIVFDDHGYMYFTVGDRGVSGTAQDLNNHNGTVMRLFDDGTVPPDNPFINTPGAMPEIWSYGHRNIQGMALHPVERTLWAHEHGPKGGDEINLILKGGNYGWPLVTHGINYDGSIITNDTTTEGMIDPILHWTPSIAPCGMTFVTGDKFPQWKNNILAGALAGQHIHRVKMDGNNIVETEKLLKEFARFRDVRQGPDGYIYVLTEGPGLFVRLIPE
ncbi:MAG: PQQ-dependent sugar dehydrogenase [Bacteroidales bacterium]